MESFTENIDGVNVTVIDTPGFSDPSKTDGEVIGEMSKESDKIDLVLFCVKMDRRMKKADYRIMRKLTRAFGESIWQNVLFVLTFANKVDPTKFTSIRAEWDELLREHAHTKGEVPPNVAQKIPIVVAGNEEERLPVCESWFTNFWVRAFLRTKDSAKPAYLTLTLRLNKLDLEDSDDDDDSPVGLSSSQRKIVKKNARKAREENKKNGVQSIQCDAKPKSMRGRHATPYSSSRPQQKGNTNLTGSLAPDVVTTPDLITRHLMPEPGTGIMPHRLTQVSRTGERLHPRTLVSDNGGTSRRLTQVSHTGERLHSRTPVPDTGATSCRLAQVSHTGERLQPRIPVPDIGATSHHLAQVSRTGERLQLRTPVPDTGATPCRTTDTGAKRRQSHPTPVPDTGATCHRPSPIPDTDATSCPPKNEGYWLRFLRKVIHALKFFTRLFHAKHRY